MIPNVVVINDMSCYGKCALTVALPVISALGVEAVPLPTAILSTHTGGFGNNTKLDMTDEMGKIISHWQAQKISFSGIYTGYFCNPKQLLLTMKFIEDFKNDNPFIIVDPIMGDNGKLYKGFDDSFLDNMRTLCGYADIITPNLTEAAFLTGLPFNPVPSKEELESLSAGLIELGAKKVIITGIQKPDHSIGILCSDSVSGDSFSFFHNRSETNYHGCGDILASALCGSVLKGMSFKDSAKKAFDFITKCIEITHESGTDPKLGLQFEKCLSDFSNF